MLQRIVWLLTKKGMIEMPEIDGRKVRVISKSPLARAQRFDDIERMRGFSGDVLSIFGPQLGQLYLNADNIVEELREKWEVPAGTVTDKAQREDAMSQAGELIDQVQPGGLPAQTAIGQ